MNRLLRHFTYEHLPQPLAEVSRPFCDLAAQIDNELEDCAEKTMALRKLLEAKDCAVRARLEEIQDV